MWGGRGHCNSICRWPSDNQRGIGPPRHPDCALLLSEMALLGTASVHCARGSSPPVSLLVSIVDYPHRSYGRRGGRNFKVVSLIEISTLRQRDGGKYRSEVITEFSPAPGQENLAQILGKLYQQEPNTLPKKIRSLNAEMKTG